MPQGFPGFVVAGTKTPKSFVDTGSGPLWDKESGPPGRPNPRQDNVPVDQAATVHSRPRRFVSDEGFSA